MDNLILITILIISGFIGQKLYSAAEKGNLDEVDTAITKGADVQWKNAKGK